jgi:hypothetical protein
MHVASVCFKCLRCFVCMLQVSYLDVVYVCNGYTYVFKFSGVFESVSVVRMLQVFHLKVAKVDMLLHMLQ